MRLPARSYIEHGIASQLRYRSRAMIIQFIILIIQCLCIKIHTSYGKNWHLTFFRHCSRAGAHYLIRALINTRANYTGN